MGFGPLHAVVGRAGGVKLARDAKGNLRTPRTPAALRCNAMVQLCRREFTTGCMASSCLHFSTGVLSDAVPRLVNLAVGHGI